MTRNLHLVRCQTTYVGPGLPTMRTGSTWELTLAAERVEAEDGRLAVLLAGQWTNVHAWLTDYTIDSVRIEPYGAPAAPAPEVKCSCGWLGRLQGRTVCPNCGAPAATLRTWTW